MEQLNWEVYIDTYELNVREEKIKFEVLYSRGENELLFGYDPHFREMSFDGAC